MKTIRPILTLAMLAALWACGPESPKLEPADKTGDKKTDAAKTDDKARYSLTDAKLGGPPAKEPDYVTVQHLLIGFKGTVPGKLITRTRDEAKKLAESLFEKVKAGENFELLIKQYTDDRPPGIYAMANHGKPADPSKGITARKGMVPAFGDYGFPLPVGGVALAPYDPVKSKYGWHIIKRLK